VLYASEANRHSSSVHKPEGGVQRRFLGVGATFLGSAFLGNFRSLSYLGGELFWSPLDKLFETKRGERQCLRTALSPPDLVQVSESWLLTAT